MKKRTEVYKRRENQKLPSLDIEGNKEYWFGEIQY